MGFLLMSSATTRPCTYTIDMVSSHRTTNIRRPFHQSFQNEDNEYALLQAERSVLYTIEATPEQNLCLLISIKPVPYLTLTS